jgi:acetyl esterase/lipase
MPHSAHSAFTRRASLALALLSGGLGLGPSHAGPLAERLREHRLECPHQAEAQDEGDGRPDDDQEEGQQEGPRPSLQNLHYGPDPRQVLDVYLPPRPHRGNDAPLILMIHGGGWHRGDKAMGRVITHKAERWLPRGFVLASANYRMLPDTPIEGQLEDVARALAHVQQHAHEWGAHPGQIVLMGHSAGAHLVALLAAQPERWSALGLRPWLATIPLDSAAMDVPTLMARRHPPRPYDPAFGSDPARWRALSPLHVLQPGARPLLVVCSTRRPDQPCRESAALVQQAERLGITAQLLPQPLSHRETNEQLGLPGPYTQQVEAFMARLHPALAQRLQAP